MSDKPASVPAIKWTRPLLTHFRREYDNAIGTRQDGFEFNGIHYEVGYAKYVIEFIETEFQRRGI